MGKDHKHKSEKKRKLSLEDSDKDTTCHKSMSGTPKTKKKKMIETVDTDPSYSDLASGNISDVKKQKKRSSLGKDKIDEKDKTVEEDKTYEIQEGDVTKMKRKKKSKKTDKDKENKSLKPEIIEPTAHDSEQVISLPEDRLEIQEGGDTEVKGKKKKKKKGQGKGSSATSPENLQTTSLDGAEKCDEESKTLKDQEVDLDDTEKTGKKKSKKNKIKDKVKNSLGTVDSELVESTAKSLQINGLDVSNPDSSQNTDKGVSNTDSSKEANTKKSTEKKKKKKKKKTNKQAGKKDDTKSDQNIPSISRHERALSYLRLWNVDKASWKFNKMNQIQLLHMIYDASLVNEDDFQILLLYLADMKGHSKEKTHDQAMKLINGDAENGEDISTFKEQRAREVVQVLS